MNGLSELRHRPAGVQQPNSKIDGEKDYTEPVNPFVHNIHLGTYDRIKVYILTVVLMPVRVVIVFTCLLVAYLLAYIGTMGLSQEDLNQKPMKGWRRQLRAAICWWMQKMFFSIGFYRVTIKGVRASEKEAPILALAPHSSFHDAFPVVLLTAPSLVVKADTQKIPFFAKLINYTQPVYVWREDTNSRQNTIKEIIRRVTSPDEWQQILIFPEGTCTNRKSLITFKPGAFYPGVPVQPVCIRYPNRLDTLSWTWQGPGALELLWLTMTQFCTYCELEFLPVYVPSEEEKRNPRLFASNVRDVMAKALKVPITDYTYEDCRLMSKAKKHGFPPAMGLIEVQKIREEYSLGQRVVEDEFLTSFMKFADSADGLASILRFANYLHLPVDHPKVVELFHIFDSDRSGMLNFKKYVVGRCSLSVSMMKFTRPDAISWKTVKDYLQLTVEELESLNKFTDEFDQHDIVDQLCTTIPEWSWIIWSLCFMQVSKTIKKELPSRNYYLES